MNKQTEIIQGCINYFKTKYSRVRGRVSQGKVNLTNQSSLTPVQALFLLLTGNCPFPTLSLSHTHTVQPPKPLICIYSNTVLKPYVCTALYPPPGKHKENRGKKRWKLRIFTPAQLFLSLFYSPTPYFSFFVGTQRDILMNNLVQVKEEASVVPAMHPQ